MRRLLALTLVLLAFVATHAFAVGEARVEGKVFDGSTKKPIPNPIILVESAEKAKTFKQEFKGKADGSYAIFLLDGTIKYKMTYSAPGWASSNASDRYGSSSGKIGTMRDALPSKCSVLGERTVNRPCTQ